MEKAAAEVEDRLPNLDGSRTRHLPSRSFLITAGLSVGMCVVVLGLIALEARSVFLVGNWLRGDVLVVQTGKPIRSEDSAMIKWDIDFNITNISRKPVKVVGVNASCTCVAHEQPPFDIPARSTNVLRVTQSLGLGQAPRDESVTLFTNAAGHASLLLMIPTTSN